MADLTWAEQRLISLYRVTIHVLYFRNEDLPGQRDSQQARRNQNTLFLRAPRHDRHQSAAAAAANLTA